ncbi:MAG: PIG-L family deacetylase [Thermomicrobiales bacterium]|nr:PIG-L family deacetylase [Thermomicrobiales bacterium]
MTLRLMGVLAHPDDESLGFGGTFAKYAADGVETMLVTATRGERGWTGDPLSYPGPWELGRRRERELRRAAGALSIRQVVFLDEMDGELHCVSAPDVTAKIAAEIRRFRPDVVVTFGPDGAYGHPDHIAISQQTTAAVTAAADPAFPDIDGEPHRVSKLYYRVWTASEEAAYRSVFGDVSIKVDGAHRSWFGWPDWAVSARLDTADYWSEVSEAVACHQSQIGGVAALTTLTARDRRLLWGTQQYFRAMSTVDVGPEIEDDLFAGIVHVAGMSTVEPREP